jgi:hypothetical protein
LLWFGVKTTLGTNEVNSLDDSLVAIKVRELADEQSQRVVYPVTVSSGEVGSH